MHCLCALASNAHLSPAQGQGQVLAGSASSKCVLAMSFCPSEEQLQNKRRQSEHAAQARACFVMVLAHRSRVSCNSQPITSSYTLAMTTHAMVRIRAMSQPALLIQNVHSLGQLQPPLWWRVVLEQEGLEQSPSVGWGVHWVGYRKPAKVPGSFQPASSALFLGVSKHVCSLFMSSILVSYSLPVSLTAFQIS